MANLYPPEVNALDQIYQKEPTVQNELALETAKLNYYRAQLVQSPEDKELQKRVRYHEGEVDRLQVEAEMANK